MANIYIVQCPLRRLPAALEACTYVFVKARPDGMEVLLLTEESLADIPEAEPRSEWAAQQWLDSVVADEAAALEGQLDPATGEPIRPPDPIRLEDFLARGVL